MGDAVVDRFLFRLVFSLIEQTHVAMLFEGLLVLYCTPVVPHVP